MILHLIETLTVVILFKTIQIKAAIDCYSCSSTNGTDPHCEDPMAPAFMKLDRRCMVPKENHVGKFPAKFCIKMIGTSVATGTTLVVRTCVIEDMNSQCGTFKFQNDTLKGCLLTCDYDGCNRAVSTFQSKTFGWMLALFFAHKISGFHNFGF